MLLRRLGPVLAVLLLVLAAAASASARRSVPRGWLGVVDDGTLVGRPALLDPELGVMRASGVESMRVIFNWSYVQPDGPGYPSWSSYDPVVAASARRGIPLLADVVLAPQWAASDPGAIFPQPRRPALYARFLTLLVHRYGPRGTFWAEHPELPRRLIRSWQVWNEPNLSYWWTRPWPKTYTALVKAAYRAVKRADRGARVILAGLTDRSASALESLYAQHARRYFDAVALHPYKKRVSELIAVVRRVRAVMRRHGDRRKPILLTEISWPSARGRTSQTFSFVVSRREQAQRVRAVLRALARERRRLGIAGVYWYDWASADASRQEPFGYAGLRSLSRGRVSAKPSLAAYAREALRLEGRR